MANSVAQEKSNGEQTFGFVDNRPETITQRKLQRMVTSPGIIQRIVTPVSFGQGARWRSSEIPDRTFATEEEAQAAENLVLQTRTPSLITPTRFGRGVPWASSAFPGMTFTQEEAYAADEKRRSLGEDRLLFSSHNYSFSTQDDSSGRAPTHYFRSTSEDESGRTTTTTGRIRQEHDSGPLVRVDPDEREHVFFDRESIADRFEDYDMKSSDEEYNLDEAKEGDTHLEMVGDDVVHRSGGTVRMLDLSEEDVDRALQDTIARGNVRRR